MAIIIQDTKQMEALREINDLLELTGRINSALEPDMEYSLVASTADSSRAFVKIPIEAEDRKKITSILNAERSRIAKAVNTKATKFKISLDEGDMAILNGAATKRHTGRPKKQDQEEVSEETAEASAVDAENDETTPSGEQYQAHPYHAEDVLSGAESN